MNLLISLSTLATKAARVLDPKNYTYRKQMTIFHTPSFPAYGKVQNCSLPQWCSSQNQSSPVWIFMALGCLLKGCCSCISNPKSQTVLYKYLVPLIVSVIHSGRSFSLWIFQTMGVVCESDHEIKLHILTLDPSWQRITCPPKFRTKCSPQKSPQQDERTWFVPFLGGVFSIHLQPTAFFPFNPPSTSPAQRWR